MKPNDSNTLYILHTNFNGSIEKISDHAGNVVDSMSYTPFGQRRMFSDWSKTDTATHLIDCGFTGQQHLDNFALINFNGRMYDSVLAHFFVACKHPLFRTILNCVPLRLFTRYPTEIITSRL